MLDSHVRSVRTVLAGSLLALGAGFAACSEPAARPSEGPPASHPSSTEWMAIKSRIRKTFPSVEEISTEELAAHMARGQATQNQPGTAAEEGEPNQPGTRGRGFDQPGTGGHGLLLVDVRGEAEYVVSHLRGARRYEPAWVGDLVKNREIVLYCSVGYRSAELAKDLMEQGFTRVRNLEGSIFEWANEGRPLWSSAGRVQTVHPYDLKWGRLLDARYRDTRHPDSESR